MQPLGWVGGVVVFVFFSFRALLPSPPLFYHRDAGSNKQVGLPSFWSDQIIHTCPRRVIQGCGADWVGVF